MFFQEQDNSGGIAGSAKEVAANIKLADINLKSFAETLSKELSNVTKLVEEVGGINSKTAQEIRQSLGQTRVVSNQVQGVLAEASKTTRLLGINTEDNIKLFGALNQAMQRNTYFTDDQITRFQTLGLTANMTAENLADMATSFDTLGFTTNQALDTMEEMTKQARSYGLNVSTFMEGVNKNLKLMTAYNFKDGVQGLSKMVAQAQALRIDMNQSVAFADKLLSPEFAIETAASFQMLGGEVGALGNAFELLGMAQTNVGGIQDALVDMAASSVIFNEESGQFELPITQMYRLREAADKTGIGYEQLTQMAMTSAQKTEKLKLLSQFTSLPEEQKELISNLGKIGPGGIIELTMPDGEVKKIGQGFNELVGSDYMELQKMLDVNNMSELDVAKTSMGYLDEIKNAQDTIIKLAALNLAQSGNFEKFAENAAEAQRYLTTEFLEQDKVGAFDLPENIVNATGTLSTQLKLNRNDAKEIASGTASFFSALTSGLDSALSEAMENFDLSEVKSILSETSADIGEALRSTFETIKTVTVENGTIIVKKVPQADMVRDTKVPQADLVQPVESASPTIPATNNDSSNTPSSNNNPQDSINVNVNGEVSFNLNGTQLNQNDSAQLTSSLIQSPEFIAGLSAKLKNSNNNYEFNFA